MRNLQIRTANFLELHWNCFGSFCPWTSPSLPPAENFGQCVRTHMCISCDLVSFGDWYFVLFFNRFLTCAQCTPVFFSNHKRPLSLAYSKKSPCVFPRPLTNNQEIFPEVCLEMIEMPLNIFLLPPSSYAEAEEEALLLPTTVNGQCVWGIWDGWKGGVVENGIFGFLFIDTTFLDWVSFLSIWIFEIILSKGYILNTLHQRIY